MASECWNKILIPFPSAASSSRIKFTDSLDLLIESLLGDCENVLVLFNSEVLQTEIRVLYELLHVLNNGFRQHKPFRALKQVEQCINRLKEMKLQAAVNDLREVCPKKFEREAGAEAGECDVPSQPMLEWLSLKLLGGSSLLARTMERCTKAFLLTQQHMSVGEYIVVNVVVTSMLSRLWVFFKGILRALIPMYGRINNLLQEVSCSHPMVYLTNFTLPKDLSEYLCLSFPHPLIQEVKEPSKAKKRKTKFAVLNQLFGGNEQKEREEQKVMTMAVRHSESSGLDLGAAVPYREVVSHCGVDIKDMLLSSCKTSQQETLKKQTDARQASVCQKMKFLKMLKKVSCFRTMSAFLKQVMTWCRRCKFLHERKRLAFLSLKCVRMESLQAEGVCVAKRLKKFKLRVRKALILQKTTSPNPPCSFTPLLRIQWQNRFIARHKIHRPMLPRRCSPAVRDWFATLGYRKCRVTRQKSVHLTTVKKMSLATKKEKTNSQTCLQKPNDDIDDIFNLFGF